MTSNAKQLNPLEELKARELCRDLKWVGLPLSWFMQRRGELFHTPVDKPLESVTYAFIANRHGISVKEAQRANLARIREGASPLGHVDLDMESLD